MPQVADTQILLYYNFMYSGERYTPDSVRQLVEHDKAALFSLTDAVVRAAPARRWGGIVNEAVCGHFVARHLHRVVSQVITPPQYVAYASSRKLARDTPVANEHHRIIQEDAVARQMGNALLVTEYVRSGKTSSRLADTLERAGAQTDIALLQASPGCPSNRTLLAGAQGTRTLYEPSPSAAYFPNLAGSELLKEATGLKIQPYYPEAVPDPDVSAELVTITHAAFEALTDEYLATRLS